MPSGRTNNFRESGCGLGHVTLTIFGIRSNISLKLLELGTSNLIHGFVWGMPSRRTNTIFGSTVGYPSDSLASCFYRAICYAERGLYCYGKSVRLSVRDVEVS